MPAKLLFQTEKSKVRCLACRHKCLLTENKRGICGVRENQRGKLKLLVHSKVIAKHIDPIEKKPLYHFLPGTKIYSIGTVGCNFHCGFCQNWQISQEKEILGEDLPPEKVKEEARLYPSIAYTYNEPTIFLEYAQDIAQLTLEKKHIFVSNGYFSDETLRRMKFIDAINIDLKSFRNEFYLKQGGAQLQPVLDNIKNCYDYGIWVEVTTLLIPGENDSEEEIRNIAQFLAGIDKEIPWHLSAFHPDYKMTDKPTTPFPTLRKALDIAKAEGLAYVYLGNVSNKEYNSTYCPQCRQLLVRREGYHTTIEGLKGNKCRYCHYLIKGIWS